MVQNNSTPPSLPSVIQGGMGIGVSGWQLARAVARHGQLGVVSGTALNTVLIRRLQEGDPGGHVRRALAACPLPEAAARIEHTYFIPGGLPPGRAYRLAPLYSLNPTGALTELTIIASFVEVFLAKEGHTGIVGINLLEKIQIPIPASLFGAMLAGVDYVLVGAGIPRAIPGLLDRLAACQPVRLKIAVEGATAGSDHVVTFDPTEYFELALGPLKRPAFLAIVSSSTLATTLARKADGRVDGFIVEGPKAGGHNAPPRGQMQKNARGEPLYGPRDEADLAAIRALGLPFWLAGTYAHPEKLQQALELGATGVQIGTAFAFCEESGLRDEWKQSVLKRSSEQSIDMITDALASPTGMPFKVVSIAGTASEPEVYAQRERVCDLGYLRQPYEKPDGSVGYRCPAEPVQDYVRKGGDIADTVGRKCLCNGLFSAIDLAQSLDEGAEEPALITAGEDVADIARFLAPGKTSYSAADVLHALRVLPVTKA